MNRKLDKMGRSELHYASNEGNIGKVCVLISEGSDVNLKDKNGWTPLHFAAQSRSAKIAARLLEHGAEIDARDNDGNTPLFRAVYCYSNDGVMIELLRNHGADPYSKNNFGNSPVGLARRFGNRDVAKYFKDLP
jgi:ankyrin repeat protein